MLGELGDEGETATDVGTANDYRPDGTILTDLSLGSGIDIRSLGAPARATLRAAASGTDAEVRAALVATCGEGAGRAWDDAPHQDGLHGPYVPAYVSIRPRIRAMLGALP